jgi:hypothetical protein
MNNRKVLAVKIQMQDMITVLFQCVGHRFCSDNSY